MKFHFYIACTAAAFLTSAAPASAQLLNTTEPAAAPDAGDAPEKTFSGMIAIGGALAPSYDGASTYDPVPFAMANIRYRGIEFKAAGPSLAINVAGDSSFEFGPVIGYSGGRDAKDTFNLVQKFQGVAARMIERHFVMTDDAVVKISHIHRAIRCHFNVHRAEPGIGTHKEILLAFRNW